MWFNQLIFTLLTEERSTISDIVLTEVINIRHTALTNASKSLAPAANEVSPLSSSSELLTVIKRRLLCLCRLIFKNLVIPVNDDTIYRELAPRLHVQLTQMSHMAQETATLDYLVQLKYFSCQDSFRDYLDALKTHLNEYLIPHKNDFDKKLSYAFLVQAQLMENEKRMAIVKKALQVCPNREEAKKRMDKNKEMQDKIASLTGKIVESKKRLTQFKSLDARLVKKLKQVHDELIEKRWAAEQLGCLSFADTSALEQ